MLVSSRLAKALRDGAPLALLCFVDHPDGPVYTWSHVGDLKYDGQTWQGIGSLGKVSAAAKTTNLSIKQVTLSLSGVPPIATKFLGSKVRGRAAQVWLAAMSDRSRRVIGTPELVIDAVLDYQVLKVEQSGLCTIDITGNVGFVTLERATNFAWTHEWQQSVYPGDTGLSLIPSLTNKSSLWRLSA